MEFLGWYTTGGPPDQSDIHIHKQVGRMYPSFGYICLFLVIIDVIVFECLRCVRLLRVRSSSN